MSRAERLIVLLSYVIALGILFGVATAAGASIGPIELVAVLLLALPLAVLVSRALRSWLLRRRSVS